MATVRARENFGAFIDHGVVSVAAGQPFGEGDPIVQGREHLFISDDTGESPDGRKRRGIRRTKVEQATAAPGERRDAAPAQDGDGPDEL